MHPLIEHFQQKGGAILLRKMRQDKTIEQFPRFGEKRNRSRRVERRKRMLDLLIAVPALAAALPFLAVSAVLVRATSEGPVVFAQTRVGKDGRPFRCYKLRTMFSGTPSVPTHETSASAVTPIGYLLRRSKVDELPQLWNVIRGDMSLVGPRPCLPVQDRLILHRTQLGVSSLKPGITGIAQVRGIDIDR